MIGIIEQRKFLKKLGYTVEEVPVDAFLSIHHSPHKEMIEIAYKHEKPKIKYADDGEKFLVEKVFKRQYEQRLFHLVYESI